MKQFKILLCCMVTLFLPFISQAAPDKEPTMFVYATYFSCYPDAEKAVDKLVKDKYAPIYDAAVKDGVFNSWGWMAHHTGGKWRRILHFAAPTVEDVFKGQAELNKRMEKAFGDGPDAMSGGCKSHVDYLWQTVAGSNVDKDKPVRGDAAMSVYSVCDITKEERADEIVKKHFAPVYDSFVKPGRLTSWGYLTHVIGGKYRKLSTMTAANHSDLLQARAEILDKLFYQGDSKVGQEYSEICGSHQDYLWTNKH